MPRLAWDTSSLQASLALETQEGILETSIDARAGASEFLLHAIDALLKRGGIHLKEVEAFAVGIGPGSFTGLRIGIATARSLAFVLKRPLYGIPSLEANCRLEAARLLQEGIDPSSRMAWVRNAFGGEVYGRIASLQGHLEGKGEERCAPPEEWANAFEKESLHHLTGEGTELLSAPEGARIYPSQGGGIARALLEIAGNRRKYGDPGDWKLVMPRYLKGSSAEEKRAREKPLPSPRD